MNLKLVPGGSDINSAYDTKTNCFMIDCNICEWDESIHLLGV